MKNTLPSLHVSVPDNFSYERYLYTSGMHCVAGCDEVGRGPLAGPVLAACIVLPLDCDHVIFKDSKALSHSRRLYLSGKIKALTSNWGIGIVSWTEIDQLNILQASLLAMKRAVQNMKKRPDFILVDGKFEIPVATAQRTLIKGETKSASIAAASILAKVARDELMDVYHEEFPAYNFAQNKGYPTREHREAVKRHGPCAIHRLTFKGVKDYVR